MNLEKIFGVESRVFMIAEIGNNHNGSVKRAKQMISLAKDCGADCVKFQMRNAEALYRQKSLRKESDDLGSEYILDLLEKFELSAAQHKELFDHAKEIGVSYMCTPWDPPSMDVLNKFGIQGVKVASADLTNLPFLGYIAKFNLPMILSTGMSTEDEIVKTIKFLNSLECRYCLLHCNSTYPAPFEDINLRWMERLQKLHPYIGYSGHERGTAVSIAAAALGATVIERHFTLDRKMEGPDHAASLTPEDFKILVGGIRQVETAMGQGKTRSLTQGELINRENLAKSLIAKGDLRAGHTLCRADVDVKSPGQGLNPQYLDKIIGLKLLNDKSNEDFFFENDFFPEEFDLTKLKFNLPWGIPVRPHDAEALITEFAPQVVEYHLSYTDLTLDFSKYLSSKKSIQVVVHAPELFEDSHLLDLASPCDQYRSTSLQHMQLVIKKSLELKSFYPQTTNVLIVANVGGFSMDEPLPAEVLADYYARLSESLSMLKTDGVEIIPQSMAPFPWHFGGQRFQNLLVYPDTIVSKCKQIGFRICLDVSHTKLVCEHFGIDFYSAVENLAPFVAHLHIGDAKGTNGEGLQIGTGEIDFVKLGKILVRDCGDASFIPEVWQGHKNHGHGFKIALERLHSLI